MDDFKELMAQIEEFGIEIMEDIHKENIEYYQKLSVDSKKSMVKCRKKGRDPQAWKEFAKLADKSVRELKGEKDDTGIITLLKQSKLL